jgi:hypothetical protein
MVLFDKGGHTLKTLDFKRSRRELQYQLYLGDTWGRIEAARALGELGADDEAAQALGAVLLDESVFWGLRKECALALAKNTGPVAQRSLLDGLSCPAPRVRLAVTEALDNMPLTPELDGKLAALFAGDPADAIRAAALVKLVRLKSDKAHKLCQQALTIDSDKDAVRNAGVDGLVSLGMPEDAAKLRPLAAVGQPRSHRHKAIEGFVSLAKQDKDEARRAAALEFLRPMLGDWFTNTRSSAIGALVSLGDKRAVADLRRVAATDPVERIRQQADKAARDLEAQQSPQQNWDEMNSKLKALQDEVDRLKGVVGELERRTPQQ